MMSLRTPKTRTASKQSQSRSPVRSNAPMLAMVLVALAASSVMSAQSAPGSLAKAFPRETLYFAEGSFPEHFKNLYGVAGMKEAGFSQADIDEMHGTYVEMLQQFFVEPFSVAELRSIAGGTDRIALGVLDFKLPNMGGGKPSFDVARMLMVVEHSNPGALETVLRRELEGGSPTVEKSAEKDGVRMYWIDPRLGDRPLASGMPRDMVDAVNSIFRVVIGFSGDKHVIVSGREGDVITAAESLRGDLEEDDLLTSNGQFKRILATAPKDAIYVEYAALAEVWKIFDKVEQAKQVLSITEIDKLSSYGGHASMSADGRDAWGEARVLFANDQAPGWYEILRSPTVSPTLEGLLTASPTHNAMFSQWIGVENLPERISKLVEYVGPKIQEIAKIAGGAGAMPEGFPEGEGDDDGSEDGNDGSEGGAEGGADEDSPQAKAMKAQMDAVKDLLSIPTGQIAMVVYASKDGKEDLVELGGPAAAAVAFVAADLTMDAVIAKIQAVAGDQVEGMIRPAAPEGEEDPYRTSIKIGNMPNIPAIECVAIGGRPLDAKDTMVLGLGSLPGHGKFLIIGNLNGVKTVAGSMAVKLQNAGTSSAASGACHVSIKLRFGDVMRSIMTVAFQFQDEIRGAADGQVDISDPINQQLMDSMVDLLADFMIGGKITLDEKAMRFQWELRGMPTMAQSSKLMKITKNIEKKEEVEQALYRIRSQVIFQRIETGSDAFPATLAELVKEDGLTEDNLLDPMGGAKFEYRQPKAGTDTFSRYLLAWQATDQFDGLGRVVILLNGETEFWNAKQFEAAKKLSDEGKPVPKLDREGNAVPLKGQWKEPSGK